MDHVRIGFVGVGMMGQAAHLRHYAALPECKVAAIAEPRQELARRVAARYEILGVFATAEEMLESVELDAIVAIQQFERHGNVVLPLFRYGKPLLTEKPLASSLALGERMVAESERHGSWHMVGYHKRNDPAVRWALLQIAATPELGELRYVRITMPPGDWIAGGFTGVITTQESPPVCEADPADESVSAEQHRRYVEFVNYYIHQVNLLRAFIGSYKVVFGDRKVLVARSDLGVTGVIEMAPYTTETEWHERVLIGFENGHLEIKLPAPLASIPGSAVLRVGMEERRPMLSTVSAMASQARNFVGAVTNREPAACLAAEALEDLRVARQWLELSQLQ